MSTLVKQRNQDVFRTQSFNLKKNAVQTAFLILLSPLFFPWWGAGHGARITVLTNVLRLPKIL